MAAEIITAKSLNLCYGTDGKTSASDRGHHALKDINEDSGPADHCPDWSVRLRESPPSSKP